MKLIEKARDGQINGADWDTLIALARRGAEAEAVMGDWVEGLTDEEIASIGWTNAKSVVDYMRRNLKNLPPPRAPSNGWIDHDGGPCPVDGETEVQVVLRSYSRSAKEFRWGHLNSVTDIVAYRVVTPKREITHNGRVYVLKE